MGQLHNPQELSRRLEEAEEALRALRSGEADAVFVDTDREQVYVLDVADKPYQLLVEQMQQGAATLTVDGTIIHCNPRFVDLLRQPLQALLGKTIRDLVAHDSGPILEVMLRESQLAEARGEIVLQRGDGTAVQAYFSMSMLNEGAFGSCLILTDLTEHRHYEELQRTQQALLASEEKLRNADQKKNEFLATLAHELRNPLAPIRNAVQIIRQSLPDQKLDRTLEMLDRQVTLMSRLLDDLLDVSRISHGTLELRKERCELVAILETALETSQPLIDAGGHELILTLPSEAIRLRADAMRLAQVFANLLNNAAKYTEKGGTIRLTAERSASEVIVTIADSGIGISPETLPNIFEIFWQDTEARIRSQGGLGIGLSLVKGVLELHGGIIEVHSDGLGKGSEFVVRLPVT